MSTILPGANFSPPLSPPIPAGKVVANLPAAPVDGLADTFTASSGGTALPNRAALMEAIRGDAATSRAVSVNVQLEMQKARMQDWKRLQEMQSPMRDVDKQLDNAKKLAKTEPAAPKPAGLETGVGQALRVGGGLLSVAGGGLTLRHAAEEYQDGKKGDAALSATEGTLGVVGGSAMALGATTLGPVALAGAGAVAGGRQIAEGVQTGNAEKISVGSVKTVAAAAMGAAPFVSGTVVGAPVGAVLGAGGALLYGGASLYENRDQLGKWAGEAYEGVRKRLQ